MIDFYHSNKSSSPRWIFITVINFHHSNNISSQWLSFITIINSLNIKVITFIAVINLHQNGKFSWQWLIYITLIDFHHIDKSLLQYWVTSNLLVLRKRMFDNTNQLIMFLFNLMIFFLQQETFQKHSLQDLKSVPIKKHPTIN